LIGVSLLEHFITSLHFPAQLWTGDGAVALTNARFNTLLGLPGGLDWARHSLSLIKDPQLQDETLQACFRRALGGIPGELHGVKYSPARNPLASGSDSGELTLSLQLRPLPPDCSTPDCVVCMIGDFTSTSERYEAGLIRSQKMENIEILASGVAHEFNNIFTGIKGMTDLIKYEVDTTSDVYEFAESIEETIVRGAQLIQKLSIFARDMPYSLRRQSIGAYLKQAIPLLELQVRRRIGITLDVQYEAEVLCDTHHLDQALGHIAVNARDAMGGQGKILITVEHAAPRRFEGPGELDWVLVRIGDTGPGIPEDIQQRVLEPFFSTKERGKSTGLGLTVAHRIIAAQNGVMEIGTSADLGGAEIRIYLPVASPVVPGGTNAGTPAPAAAP
jgi:signal transduction histidine kinase